MYAKRTLWILSLSVAAFSSLPCQTLGELLDIVDIQVVFQPADGFMEGDFELFPYAFSSHRSKDLIALFSRSELREHYLGSRMNIPEGRYAFRFRTADGKTVEGDAATEVWFFLDGKPKPLVFFNPAVLNAPRSILFQRIMDGQAPDLSLAPGILR